MQAMHRQVWPTGPKGGGQTDRPARGTRPRCKCMIKHSSKQLSRWLLLFAQALVAELPRSSVHGSSIMALRASHARKYCTLLLTSGRLLVGCCGASRAAVAVQVKPLTCCENASLLLGLLVLNHSAWSRNRNSAYGCCDAKLGRPGKAWLSWDASKHALTDPHDACGTAEWQLLHASTAAVLTTGICWLAALECWGMLMVTGRP
jgi:hypothetical protein